MSALGLVDAFGHVSAREGAAMLITPAVPLSGVTRDDLVTVPLDATRLPPGAPAESWLHLRVYAARPDVAAVARAQPPDVFAVAAVADRVRPLHGQGAWVGRSVPVHADARLLRSRDLADAAVRTLGRGDAVAARQWRVHRLGCTGDGGDTHVAAVRDMPGLAGRRCRRIGAGPQPRRDLLLAGRAARTAPTAVAALAC
ncbi:MULTISPECIES: class II aldolase/adducin family protein [Streptomyces violaceusniger group]|nr:MULTISPECIES: class II aldolase/adducin family protein [Streptomyces violaceusniger group]